MGVNSVSCIPLLTISLGESPDFWWCHSIYENTNFNRLHKDESKSKFYQINIPLLEKCPCHFEVRSCIKFFCYHGNQSAKLPSYKTTIKHCCCKNKNSYKISQQSITNTFVVKFDFLKIFIYYFCNEGVSPLPLSF